MNNINSDIVSIITPVYNAESFLEDTVNSVLKQTYQDWEMILIDDCSTDKSREIMEKLALMDDRIVPIYSEVNEGVANSRNKGIEKAKGRYIAFLDSDDLWKPNKLEEQVKFMKSKDIAFSFTGYEFINEDGERLGKIISIPSKVTYNELLKYNCIGCLTVMIDKKKIDKVEMPTLKHEDFITWLSILKKDIDAYGINENLASYRKRTGSVSENKIKSATWTWNILRNIEKLNVIKASWCFANYAFITVKKHYL